MREIVIAGLAVLVGCAGAEPQESLEATGAAAAALAVGERPDGDILAQEAYARVQNAFTLKQAGGMTLGVYALEPVGNAQARAQERARALGLERGALRTQEEGVVVAEEKRELRVNALSGTERFIDQARFHSGKGVAVLPLAESEYVSRARAYMGKVLPEVAARGLRTYRVRRYMNEEGGPGGVRSGPRVYQVAVAFHEVVEGLPVIGPGGKVAVHLTPEGEVISYESTVRAVGARLATLSEGALVAPEEARKQVEARLVARGVRLEDYRLARAELGYLRQGRNSVQSVLAPHYAYVYEPLSPEVLGKKLVEVVPAVVEPTVQAQLRQDEQAEAARQARRRAHATPESRR